MSVPPEKIEYLDFAKGYAIFTIVLYHALQRVALPPLLSAGIVFGGSGVHLFFLLSGFGLAWSRAVVTPVQFYRRRLTKVWLPYVLALTISLLAALAFDLFPDRWDAWLAGVGLYQMFYEPYVQSFGGHFWFISTIVQFYLVFPLLRKIQLKLADNHLFFLLLLTVSVAWWVLVFLFDKGALRSWNSCFLQFLWEFGLGMVLADEMKKPSPDLQNRQYGIRNAGLIARKYWWAFLPIGLFFTAVMVGMILKMGAAGRIFNDVPALLGYAALSLFLYFLGDRLFPLLKRFFLWINGFSFSLYLIHVLVLDGYLRWLPAAPLWWQVLLYLPLALLAGRAFEPISRWWTGLFEKPLPARA